MCLLERVVMLQRVTGGLVSNRMHLQTLVVCRISFALIVALILSLAWVLTAPAAVARESSGPVKSVEPVEPVMGKGHGGVRVALPAVNEQPRKAPEPRGHKHPSEAEADEQARQQGKKVEIVGQRTESSTLFAKPDGSRELRISTRPVRVRRGDEWVDVDPSLTRGPLGVVPKATIPGLRFSPGGLGPAVVMTLDEGSLQLGWDGALPRPGLEGATATYRDVRPGMDLVLISTATGFEQQLVLHRRPTTDVTVSMPLTLDALALEEQPQGGLRLLDGQGKVHAGGPTPIMWDSRGDELQRARVLGAAGVSEVDIEVEAIGNGRGALVLRPDLAFLADPDTVYPVTIDPALANSPDDTYVQNNYPNANFANSPHLWLGRSGGQLSRILLAMNMGSAQGKVVTNASLQLPQLTQACNPAAFAIRPILTNWNPWTVTWNTHPYVGGAETNWSGGCPNDWMSFDITGLVRSWANGSVTNRGLAVWAHYDESQPDSLRQFMATQGGPPYPVLYITYTTDPELSAAWG